MAHLWIGPTLVYAIYVPGMLFFAAKDSIDSFLIARTGGCAAPTLSPMHLCLLSRVVPGVLRALRASLIPFLMAFLPPKNGLGIGLGLFDDQVGPAITRCPISSASAAISPL